MALAKPHAVVMPYPLQGHINPLMQLSKLLAAQGFSITFVLSEYHLQCLLQAQQEQKIIDAGLDIRLMGIPDGLPSGHDRSPLNPDILLALHNLGTAFHELVEKLRQDDVAITCIISDTSLLWTQDVANKWNIPRVSFWTNSLSVLACSLHVPEIMSRGINPFDEAVYRSDSEDLVNCIPGIPSLRPVYLPFKTLHGKDSAQWLYNQVKEQLACLEQVRCVVANSFYELETQVCEHLQIRIPKLYSLGPLLPCGFFGDENAHDNGVGASLLDEDECMQWLDTQLTASVLYISLGSIAAMSTLEIQEMALGLAASKQPFLWVLRPDSGGGNITETLAEGWDKQGKVIRWAPQLRVLCHKAVGGFLTHCGWNSTLESISAGVPMIGWPKMMDQVTNCWYVVKEWKVGVKLEKGDRQEVELAVKQVMQGAQGKDMRVRASTLKQAAQSAFKQTAHHHLQLFIDCLLQGDTPTSTHT